MYKVLYCKGGFRFISLNVECRRIMLVEFHIKIPLLMLFLIKFTVFVQCCNV